MNEARPIPNRTPTLGRKMAYQIGATIVGLLLVIVAALWGLNGLRTDFGVATRGYRELRDVYEVASHVSTAKALLTAGDRAGAGVEVDRAAAALQRFGRPDVAGADDRAFAKLLDESVRSAAAALRLPDDEAFHASTRDQLDALDHVLGQVAGFAVKLQQTIRDRERAAQAKWRMTVALVAAVSLAVVVVAVGLGIWQHRSVVRPLGRLREAADRIAAGRFADRVDAASLSRSGAEFGELAADFNRMAGDLEAIYADLERQVADKSRELVRSERLASVGYLAAGVAHEINNPLGIITGYGERAIQQLERNAGEPNAATALALKNLRIMCEEAYRCKAITDRLLSLARPGEAKRAPTDLGELAREVVSLVNGLPAHRQRQVQLLSDAGVAVLAAADELKQVVLNLLLNALEAVKPGEGVVRMTVERVGDLGRLEVVDNGRGMTRETIERVFEPFFTEKRGAQGAGTGLGLSISHTIVSAHGGRMTASSEGPGRGSRFTIDLPLAISAPDAAARPQGVHA